MPPTTPTAIEINNMKGRKKLLALKFTPEDISQLQKHFKTLEPFTHKSVLKWLSRIQDIRFKEDPSSARKEDSTPDTLRLFCFAKTPGDLMSLSKSKKNNALRKQFKKAKDLTSAMDMIGGYFGALRRESTSKKLGGFTHIASSSTLPGLNDAAAEAATRHHHKKGHRHKKRTAGTGTEEPETHKPKQLYRGDLLADKLDQDDESARLKKRVRRDDRDDFDRGDKDNDPSQPE